MKNKSDFNPDDLSPLARGLYEAFTSARQRGDATLFVLWDSWGDQTHFCSVAQGQWPWSAYDQARRRNPHAALCYGFNLKQPFTDQFDVAAYGRIETLQAFAARPRVWITDRAGVVPEQARQEFYRKALVPEMKVMAGGLQPGSSRPDGEKLPPTFRVISNPSSS